MGFCMLRQGLCPGEKRWTPWALQSFATLQAAKSYWDLVFFRLFRPIIPKIVFLGNLCQSMVTELGIPSPALESFLVFVFKVIVNRLDPDQDLAFCAHKGIETVIYLKEPRGKAFPGGRISMLKPTYHIRPLVKRSRLPNMATYIIWLGNHTFLLMVQWCFFGHRFIICVIPICGGS